MCKRTGTIAEVADHLGVNRVQMNRVLNGESFPKPGLMKRICDHFSVNARILLEPLAELEAESFSASLAFFILLFVTKFIIQYSVLLAAVYKCPKCKVTLYFLLASAKYRCHFIYSRNDT